MQGLRPICVLFLLSAVSAGIVFSQAVNGTIVGTVTDASGAAVANAKVTLTETNTKMVPREAVQRIGGVRLSRVAAGDL